MNSRPSHNNQQRFAISVLLVLTIALCAKGQTTDRSLANINGRRITQEEVERVVVAQTLPLEEKLYAIRKAALENLITSRVLEDEAKKRGISVADLRKQLAGGDVQVTETQVEGAYAENAPFFASMSPDEAKERLRLDLENQQRMQNYRAELARLKGATKIELFLVEPRLPALADDHRAPFIGPKDAPITLIEYSDFECAYCRDIQPALKQLLQTYGQQIRLVFKHLPLQLHAQAFSAAHAAVCANEQNRFWEYHDTLFAARALSSGSFNKIAKDIGLDLGLFTKCFASDSSALAVRLNQREASQLGINSTPTFVINGRLVRGAADFEVLKSIIDDELNSARINSQFRTSQPARKD